MFLKTFFYVEDTYKCLNTNITKPLLCVVSFKLIFENENTSTLLFTFVKVFNMWN